MTGPDLGGRTALVTGAGSGIGAAVAETLAQRGARVFLADLDLDAAAERARALEGAEALRLDVRDPADWQDATARVLERAGGLEILVNAAGVTGADQPSDLALISLENWRSVFAVNVEGVLLGCQAALGVMETGSIVNICSTVAKAPTPTLPAYGASKAAVLQLTRTVSAWCALKGLPIRCNAVLPGMVDTPMTAGATPDYRALWERAIPLARFGEPAEVAAAVAFLASEEASYITGAALTVDGGLLSRPVVRPAL